MNCGSLDEARAFHEQLGLGRVPHGHGPVPHEYGVRYIPHKVLIGKDGKILKNYEGFDWSDIDEAMVEEGPGPSVEVSEDDEVTEAVAQVFSDYDRNGDGLIARDEFAALLQGLNAEQWPNRQVDRLLRKVDTNNDGKLDYAEILAWLTASSSGRIRRALGIASSGHDGGLAQCANMCGRAPYRHHRTCCPRCERGGHTHSRACDERAGPKCSNGCGRKPFRDFPTCCTHCGGSAGPHSRACDERCQPLCVNGCGRKACGDYPTCCTHCGGRDGPHARGCRAPTDAPRHSRESRGLRAEPEPDGLEALAKEVGVTEFFGETLLIPNGSKVGTNTALSNCQLVGILFTATW